MKNPCGLVFLCCFDTTIDNAKLINPANLRAHFTLVNITVEQQAYQTFLYFGTPH